MFENTFSKSHGYMSSAVQGKRGSSTNEAQTRLWNIFFTDFWNANLVQQYGGGSKPLPGVSEFLRGMWVDYWPGRVDEYPGDRELVSQISRNIGGPLWHLFFDIFQEIFQNERFRSLLKDPAETEQKIREALVRENTAYTFVGGFFAERMTSQESRRAIHAGDLFGIRQLSVREIKVRALVPKRVRKTRAASMFRNYSS
jgi:hypothetical protein